VETWSVQDVQTWMNLLRIDSSKEKTRKYARVGILYGAKFLEGNINGQMLVKMNDEGLKQLGIKSLGHRIMIMNYIKALNEQKGT